MADSITVQSNEGKTKSSVVTQKYLIEFQRIRKNKSLLHVTTMVTKTAFFISFLQINSKTLTTFLKHFWEIRLHVAYTLMSTPGALYSMPRNNLQHANTDRFSETAGRADQNHLLHMTPVIPPQNLSLLT